MKCFSSFLQVVVPLSLQRRVEGLLQEHLDRMVLNSEKVDDSSAKTEAVDQVEHVNTDENGDPFLDGSVMEKVLQRRSLRLRNMQRTWQVSCARFSVWICAFFVSLLHLS